MPRDLRVAIVVRDPLQVSQTFVRRHIEALFGGQTVVVTTRTKGVYPGKPTFALNARSSMKGRFRLVMSKAGVWLGKNDNALESGDFGEWANKQKVNFVLAEFGPQGLGVFREAQSAGLPMFCYFRGYDASQRLHDPAYRSALREMAGTIEGFVAVSQFLLDNLEASQVIPKRTLVIPSGTDIDLFQPKEKDFSRCLSVGRFTPKKAPDKIIRSFAQAAQSHPELTLEMIGEGPEKKRCMKLAAKLDVDKKIRFSGALPQKAVAERMASAGFFLQHSITAPDGDTEGMPSAIQEAMAAGCVVLTTRHAGIPEHIKHGVNGLMVAEGDEAGFADCLMTYLARAKECRILSEAARRHAVQHLDYRKLYRELEQAIAAIVG